MKNESANPAASTAGANEAPGLPAAVDRAAFQAELDRLREREKAHTREGGAIAAARRRLPMVEVDASLTLTGPHGPLSLPEASEGRRQLIAYFMWHPGHPAAGQCEGCMDLTVYGRQEPWEDSPQAGHNRGPSRELMAAHPIGHQCQYGRADAPSPSGLDSKLDALMTSPLGPERTRTTSSCVVTI